MTKHKHYYAIRAFADGWKIEFRDQLVKVWTEKDQYVFAENAEYRVVPDSEGWLPWYPECARDFPADDECEFTDYFDGYPTKYRHLKPVDPYAELKAAAKDPTKEISLKGVAKEILGWHSGDYWNFDLPPEAYEIRDKPKTRKVKLVSWYNEDDGRLYALREGLQPYKAFKKVISIRRLDETMIEVEVEG